MITSSIRAAARRKASRIPSSPARPSSSPGSSCWAIMSNRRYRAWSHSCSSDGMRRKRQASRGQVHGGRHRRPGRDAGAYRHGMGSGGEGTARVLDVTRWVPRSRVSARTTGPRPKRLIASLSPSESHGSSSSKGGLQWAGGRTAVAAYSSSQGSGQGGREDEPGCEAVGGWTYRARSWGTCPTRAQVASSGHRESSLGARRFPGNPTGS
jgi:hypothetical protein